MDIRKSKVSWKVVRLKDIGPLQNGISQGKDYFGFGSPFVSYGNVYNDTVDAKYITTLANSSQQDQKQYSVLEGDVFFTRTSETIEEIGISATALHTIAKATFSGFLIRLRPSKRLIRKEFSKYFFKANVNRQFLSREISLVTRASLGQNVLNNLPIILPSPPSQIAIGRYLDFKTKAIDNKVRLLEEKSAYYHELRRSLINETVTRGLKRNVKLKNSGVDWIGEIPKHWGIERAKAVFKEINLRTLTGSGDLLSVSEFYGVAKKSDVTGEEEYISRAETLEGYKLCHRGDLIINIMLAWKRGLGVSPFDGLVSPSYAVYRAIRKSSYPKFFHFLLRSDQYIAEFKRNSTGIIESRLRLYSDKFYNIPIVLPPLAEQEQIANFLDSKTNQIDQIISNIQTQITALKELRYTLINDVVTGKIKVTND